MFRNEFKYIKNICLRINGKSYFESTENRSRIFTLVRLCEYHKFRYTHPIRHNVNIHKSEHLKDSISGDVVGDVTMHAWRNVPHKCCVASVIKHTLVRQWYVTEGSWVSCQWNLTLSLRRSHFYYFPLQSGVVRCRRVSGNTELLHLFLCVSAHLFSLQSNPLCHSSLQSVYYLLYLCTFVSQRFSFQKADVS